MSQIMTTRNKQALATTVKFSYYLAIYFLSLCAKQLGNSENGEKSKMFK